jgi:hypothetical protein
MNTPRDLLTLGTDVRVRTTQTDCRRAGCLESKLIEIVFVY